MRRSALFSISAGLILTLGAAASAPTRWFSAQSPWNLPVGGDAQKTNFGATQLEAFRESGGSVILNLDLWTATVVEADLTTPRFDVQWGQWLMRGVPVPQALFPALDYLKAKNDTDRNICIDDRERGVLYTFFGVDADAEGNGNIAVRAGASFSPQGSGWWDNSIGPWAGRASGASACAGLVTPQELTAGNIPHALAAGWPHNLIRSSKLAEATVYPAQTTDGAGLDPSTALPMGTRLQLDPALTDARLRDMGLKSGDLALAHAMQKYGVYIVDSSGAFSIYFASGLGKGHEIYPNVTSPWPRAIMEFFHAARPLSPTETAPLESRLTRHEPVAVPVSAPAP